MEIKIKRKEATISSDTIEIPAQGSANIPVVLENDSSYSNYIKEVHCGYYLNGVYCKIILPIENEKYLIPLEAFEFSGPLYLAVALVNVKEIIKTNQINFEVRAAPNGKVILPTENEWHILVKNYMDSLFENDFGDRFDEIGTNLEELAAEVQTQQEKITSQQTQIDNAIGNMGDYEIVQEDPVQIRFKKGDGTFGETVDLGDGLASKAMVNAGYYTYKGISYGGSASNNGIDVAEIDGAYSQETINGFQLFDASKLPTKSQSGATVTNNGDGSFTISGSGNLTGEFSNMYNYSHEETIKLLKAGTIILKSEVDVLPKLYADFRNSNGQIFEIVNNGSKVITQEMLDNSSFYLRIAYYSPANQLIKAGTIKPMLYQDGDGTFEPFTGGIASPNPEYPQEPKFVGDYNEDTQKYDIDFMTSGKNLFDYTKSTESCYLNADGTLATTASYKTSDFIPVIGGKTYCISKRGTVRSKFYNSSKEVLNDNWATSTDAATTIIIPDEASYFRFSYCINGDYKVDEATLQLELGSVETSYEPFTGFETTTVQLNQPLRELPNGVKDTIENGVVTRRVGEITFNGSETWLKNAGNTNNWLYHIAITHVNAKGLCDSLPHNEIDVINSDGSGINRVGFNFTQYEKVMYLNVGYYMEQAGLTNTVNNLKTWLQSNPITVWYELATPTTEQITLPTLPSWYPYTDAWVGTELQPSFVEWHIKTAGANQNDLTVIKEDISQLQTETTQLNDDVTMLMGAFTSVTDLTKQLFLLMHRVGDIIFSTSDENPSTIYGGTWVAWGKGQVPVGVDTSDSDFNTVEKTGGEKEHTLTVDEMPSHKHDFGQQFATTSSLSGEYGYYMIAGTQTDVIKNTGGNQPHNNLQPYITCYMWKRTA